MKDNYDTQRERANRITQIIKRNGSGWELNDWEEDYESLLYTTRQNGDVMDGTPGKKDVLSARIIRNEILKEYPDAKIKIFTMDEWTNLDVEFNPF